MSLTSDELNNHVYRYLLESGYTHTAFSFANESLVTKANINGADVPPGSLISFVQKGMMYVEIEQHIDDNGEEIDTGDDKMSLLLPGHVRDGNDDKEDAGDPMDQDGVEIESNKITTLSGHENEVFTVAWNPVKSLLASGSGDSSARIWHVPTADSGPEAERNTQWHVLEHINAASNEKAKDVTTLDWNADGTLLATGSYDGQVLAARSALLLLPHTQTSLHQLQRALVGSDGCALRSGTDLERAREAGDDADEA